MTDLNTASSIATKQTGVVRRPELLAPAGGWDCARAAVENGADAIYFGLDRFNARMRADNFTEADLPKLLDFLHQRGVKGYITFNTLVFTEELPEAERYLRGLIAAGVDAVLVQDVGICRMIRQISPDLPIHASTQMTVTSAAGIEFARELGCTRVVLARECSVKDIARFPANDCQVETFVHGALCVAYSGQCLTSEALGGRSANRGECAQACRLPYDLFCDGNPVPLGDRRYLLSPQDLAGLTVLPELIHSGVAALKIEGRLKSPEYVANITRVYRQALDKLMENARSLDDVKLLESIRAQSQYDMEMAFSRGLYTGWLRGPNAQKLVHARFGKKRGVYLGDVKRVGSESVILTLRAPLKPGDGVVFDAGRPEEDEQGGRVYEIKSMRGGAIEPGADIAIAFGYDDVDISRVHTGDKIWKTSDPELDKRLRKTFAEQVAPFQRPIDIVVGGRSGEPLVISARDADGHVARVQSQMPLEAALTQPLDAERLRAQLGRLGGTPFKLGAMVVDLEGASMLPMSELNRLRRELVEALTALRSKPIKYTVTDWKYEAPAFHAVGHAAPELIVLVRRIDQLDTAIGMGVRTVYCDFEDPRNYREAVTQFRAATAGDTSTASAERRAIYIAPPRIFKAGEEWILKQIQSSGADGYLARNYDHLQYFAGERMVGDFSFNIANPLSARYFLEKFKLERLTASYDLNILQLESLLKSAPPEWFEVTLHQHMPMFHMDHCVFCAFLSDGTDFTNCGRPCDKHSVQLRDRVGSMHAVRADAGCRNTVFNARAQTGAEHTARLIELGLRRIRIEFVDESPDLVAKTIAKYRSLLRGEISGPEVWRDLRLWNQLGVTRVKLDT